MTRVPPPAGHCFAGGRLAGGRVDGTRVDGSWGNDGRVAGSPTGEEWIDRPRTDGSRTWGEDGRV